jgi:hypothetical protein
MVGHQQCNAMLPLSLFTDSDIGGVNRGRYATVKLARVLHTSLQQHMGYTIEIFSVLFLLSTWHVLKV